jgi:hypothetical protein
MATNYEMRPGQGSAFKNDKKTEDWHPAYKGKVMLPDGSLHWLDITPKKTKAGDTWIAVKVGNQIQGAAQPMDAHNQAKGNGYQPQPADDSDIPF